MSKLQGPRELLLSSNRDLIPGIPGTPNTQANGDAGRPHHDWMRYRSSSGLGPAAVIAGVIAGSIAGWLPLERGSRDSDSIKFLSMSSDMLSTE
jgi:P-type Ca2+ transporter type 2C